MSACKKWAEEAKAGRHVVHLTFNTEEHTKLKAIMDMRGEAHLTSCLRKIIDEERERIVEEVEGND